MVDLSMPTSDSFEIEGLNPHKKATREEFEKAAAAGLHLTLEEFRKEGWRASPCATACDYARCSGWTLELVSGPMRYAPRANWAADAPDPADRK